MAYEYFSTIPLVEHSGKVLRNLMVRAKLNNQVIGSKYHFLPYTMSYHENVTSIAHDYYGSVDYSWLVLMSAGKTDPFHAFAVEDEELEALLKKEFGSIETAKNTTLFWRDGEGREISAESKALLLSLGDSQASTYNNEITAYDYFFELNEQKRYVNLVSRDYAPQIHQELRVKMRESID